MSAPDRSGPEAQPARSGWRTLSRRTRASRLLFCTLVASDLVLAVLCAYYALAWIDTPFAGFMVNQRMVAASAGQYSWTGTRAGIKFPDRIVSANGHALARPSDLDAVVAATPLGEPVRYTIEREGSAIELSIPTMRFGLFDFAVNFGSLFLLGLLYLGIGVVVFVLKPDTAVSWAFFLVSLFWSSFYLSSFDNNATHKGFFRWYMSAIALLAAAGLHLSLLFPERRPVLRRLPFLPLLPYAIGVALAASIQWLYPAPAFLVPYGMMFVYAALAAIAIPVSSALALLRPPTPIARQRAKVVLFGAALAFPLPAAGLLVAVSGATLGGIQVQTTFLALPTFLFPASIAYAIARHNLFDVDVYIKRTVGYVLMTLVVGLAYFSIQSVVGNLVLEPAFGANAQSIQPVLFALLVVFFFNPVNQRVQGVVERLFFRKRYDYRETVAAISQALSGLRDLDAFLDEVLRTLQTKLFAEPVGVLLLDRRKHACRARMLREGRPHAEDLSLPFDDPLLSLLEREGKLLTRYDVAENPRYAAVREACKIALQRLDVSILLPLYAEGEFAGALALGNKKSGHFFSREDIDLLTTVAWMTSTEIEEASEKAQRATLMQLFSKHVSPEVAESLWERREEFLEGGRPRSQRLTVTAMFTDLQGFSTVSEQLDPETLMDWLNAFIGRITQVVMQHGGVVDDFFGDGIKVNFGVPVPRRSEREVAEDALRAVDTALAIGEETVRLNERMQERGLPVLRVRVGICTGEVLAGSLGSVDRLKYTTLGDAVNTAARLESYEKDLSLAEPSSSPARILIAESTLRHLGERFETRRVGEMSLRGKEEKVAAHLVLGRRTEGGAPAAFERG